MRIVVCVKEVPDPDAVNAYAVAGRLVIAEDGRSLAQASIPQLMNAYDEQAIEAALRLRDSGVECSITCVSAGPDPAGVLKHAAALGADEIVAISLQQPVDCLAVSRILAAWVRRSGGADLVLCGRQASDDDQGVVPAMMGEMLGIPVITVAREVSVTPSPDGQAWMRVTRVTPEGDEIVEAPCPAVVTISNELGQPRYPTAARAMAARRMQPAVVSLGDLSLNTEDLQPSVELLSLTVPSLQGNCEFISGGTAAETAARLISRLREGHLLQA